MIGELDDYPGPMVKDSERLPFSLGWEYRRRGIDALKCPLKDRDRIADFTDGYRRFRCSDKRVNDAMLKNILP